MEKRDLPTCQWAVRTSILVESRWRWLACSDADILTGSLGGTNLVWYENTACARGQYSTTGNSPCSPCPVGTFGGFIGLSSSACSGLCPAGTYSDVAGAVSCTPCPVGRYGAVPGLSSSLCSGVSACVANVTSGTVCSVGATSAAASSTCQACPPGSFANNTASACVCSLCPPGTYGSTSGLTLPSCSGPCSAVPGSYCGVGAVSVTGILCPAGSYSDTSSASVCTPCPVGTYGDRPGLNSAFCTGSCTAIMGRYCGAGMTSSLTGIACPPGTYSFGGNVKSCSLCKWSLHWSTGFAQSAIQSASRSCNSLMN